MKCYLSCLFGFILLFINIINTKSVDILSNDDKKINNDDDYYLIYINNDHGEYKVYYNANSENQKRDESQIYVESFVDELNTLIVNNKDTYKNPKKLDEIENASNLKKRKRSSTGQEYYSYNDSSFVYPISSVDNSVVLYAYLSKELAEEIPSKYDNVVACKPNQAGIYYFDDTYTHSIEEILEETKWKNLTIRENADYHLSLLSQGKYNKMTDEDYDDTYYYPSSAGRDVDLIIIDSSFNFEYSEFQLIDRIAICEGIIDDGRLRSTSIQEQDDCYIPSVSHGQVVSVTAAGETHGVANRANVFGIVLQTGDEGISEADVLGCFQYIYENMVRPYRTVINLSFGGIKKRDGEYDKQEQAIISNIVEKKKGIVVTASGNENQNLDRIEKLGGAILPCQHKNVVCVGATENGNRRNKPNAYKVSSYTNIGKAVQLYAPGFVEVEIIKRGIVSWVRMEGTSFSSPIVAGLIATIISENSEINYEYDALLDKLLNDAIVIENERDNTKALMANNGKKSFYSKAECKGQISSTFYPCCSTCEVSYVDDDDHWGYENDDWCSIKFSCKIEDTPENPPQEPEEECTGQKLGYRCCSGCELVEEDEDGRWGVENDDWCGLKYTC